VTDYAEEPLTVDASSVYRIVLQGALDASWQNFVGDLRIQVRHEGARQAVTTLTGRVIDQAALMGILNFVYDLGMPLLSVERLG
jgi:hypothetical protein